MFSGVSKKENRYIWYFMIWLIMAGGPGLVLFDTGTFWGPLPVLYEYVLVMWIVAIYLIHKFGFRIRFCDTDIIADMILKKKD
jgi:predicted membrane protein